MVSISGITISNGNAPSDPAAFVFPDGGGILNNGTLTVSGSTVSGNSAILDLDPLHFCGGPGGGVHNAQGLTVIEHSTITNNSVKDTEGNVLDGWGSGVYTLGDGFLPRQTQVLSTIISANQGTDVDSGPGTNPFVSKGYNLIGDGDATATFNQTGDKLSTEPKLGALAENGGPTQTRALLTDSPAIDAGLPVAGDTGDPICPPPETDQRGVTRPQDGNGDSTDRCDIGSFELEESENQAPTVTVARGGTCGSSGMRGTINLSLLDPDTPAQELTLTATSSNQAVVPDGNITFGGGTDTLSGGGERDTLRGQQRRHAHRGPRADIFDGGSGTDTATDFSAGEGDSRTNFP